jgi:hypothetical protein
VKTTRTFRIAAPLAVLFGALVVASCSGGSTGVNPGVLGTPPPPVIPNSTFSASGSASLSSSVTFPSAGGYTATAVFPPATNPPATLTTNVSSSALDTSTVPTLQNLARSPQALRGAQAGSITVLYFFRFLTSSSASFSNAPALTFSVPSTSIVSGVSYYLAEYDPLRPSLGWQKAFEGPAAVNGTTLTFAAPSPATPLTIIAGVPLYFALYAVSSSAPTPTPAPNVTPIPTSVSTTLPAGNPGPTFSVALGGYTIAGNLSNTNSGPLATLTANLGAAPGLPLGGLPSNANVFLTLSVSATAPLTNVANDTSAVSVTLPSSFSTSGVTIYAVGCQQAQCPYGSSSPIPVTPTNGKLTLPSGVNLPGITSTPNYVVFFTAPTGTP